MIAKEDLWLTADRSRVVSKDDRDAMFLFKRKGEFIGGEFVKRYKLDAVLVHPKPKEKKRGKRNLDASANGGRGNHPKLHGESEHR